MIRIALVMLTVVAVAGCKSKEYKQQEAEALMSTPLEFDPTERERDLNGWWSNGKQYVRLDESAAYAIYDAANAYEWPTERGRWGRTSYAVMWLEPYNTPQPEAKRVSITKIRGKLALVPPGMEPLFESEEPPTVLRGR